MSAAEPLDLGSKTLQQRFAHLIGNEEGADFWFDIVLDGQRIPAHKLFLAAGSEILSKIVYGADGFTSQETDDCNSVYDITSAGFREILRYLYTDECCLTETTAIEILKKANYYSLDLLEIRCTEYVYKCIRTDTCFDIFVELSHLIPFESIITRCLRQIRRNPITSAFEHNGWDDLEANNVKLILSSDIIHCSESDIFEALLKWAQAQCSFLEIEHSASEMRSVCNGLEQCIRWSTLTVDELDRMHALKVGFYSPDEINQMKHQILAGSNTAVKRKRMYIENANWVRPSVAAPFPTSAVYMGAPQIRPNYVARTTNSRQKQIMLKYDPMYGGIRDHEHDFTNTIEILSGTEYKWIPVGSESIPENVVPVDIEGDYVVLVARLSHSGSFYRHFNNHVKCNILEGAFCYDNGHPEESLDLERLEILVEDACAQAIPPGAFSIGLYGPHQREAYLGRAYAGTDSVPAIIFPHENLAYAPWNFIDNIVSEYEFLRIRTGQLTEWRASANGETVERAVEGGRTVIGELLYYGRAMFQDQMWYGKVHRANQAMFFGKDGKELSISRYEVLVFK